MGDYQATPTVPGVISELASRVNRLEVRVATEAPVNARYFGATGDGSTNDLSALQAGINQGAGGSVFIPAGDYKISAALTVPSNTTVFGEGVGSKLTVTSNVNVIENADQTGGNSNINVMGLWLVGTGASGTPFQKGCYLKRVTDAQVSGCLVTNMYLQGVQVDVAVRNRIVNNSVTGITNGNGISVDDDSVDVVIANNTIQDIHDSGVGTHNGSLRTLIQGNTITYAGGVGHGVDVFGAPETVVTGNIIKGAPSHGVYIHTTGTDFPNRCVVTGNLILNVTGDGVQIFASGDDEIHDCVVDGNTIYTPSQNGVYFGNGVQRSVVSNNVVNSGGESGIRMVHSGSGTPYRNLVIGNYCRSMTRYGIEISANVGDCLITGNHNMGNTLGQMSIGNVNNMVGGNSHTDGKRLDYMSPVRMSGTAGDGYVEFVEQSSDPSAPASNEARLFSKDSGGGKTQLAVRFPTGATQVIATEP